MTEDMWMVANVSLLKGECLVPCAFQEYHSGARCLVCNNEATNIIDLAALSSIAHTGTAHYKNINLCSASVNYIQPLH